MNEGVEEVVDGHISPILGTETFLNLSDVTSALEDESNEVPNRRPVAQSQRTMPVHQVLRGQQPYILEKANFTMEHIRKLEHYVMLEINDGRTPEIKALIPETNRMVIFQMLIMAQAGDQKLHDDWAPIENWQTWGWDKFFAAMKICFDDNRLGQSDHTAFLNVIDALQLVFNPTEVNCLNKLVNHFTVPLIKATFLEKI